MVEAVHKFDNQTAKKEAEFYASIGWFPTPGKPKSKQPAHGKGWSSLDCDGYDEIMKQFTDLSDKPYNVGLLVGKHVVDIDLDSPNSRRLAPYILPPTLKLKKGKEVTHYLYHMDEGLEPILSKMFPMPTEDPNNKEMLCEVRGVDGRGNYQYTLASGSVHPSGLVIERIGDQESLHTIKSHDEIYNLVRLLAFCDVMVRSWGGGSRNTLAMGVCGFLLKQGYDADDVESALEAITQVAEDDEDRKNQLYATLAKHENGEPVAGEKILKENMPAYAFDKLKSWFSNNLLSLADFDLGEIMSIELEKRWPYLVYLAELDCYTPDGLHLIKKSAVHELFARQLDQKSRNTIMALSHKLNGLGYFPGSELINIEEPNTHWNTWTPTALSPIEGDVTLFLEHIGRICDHEDESTSAMLSFMAHAVQRPAQKVRWMPLLIGGQGTGKSTLGELLGHLVGRSNFTAIPASDMLGNFNTPLKNKLVVMIEEMRISKSNQTTALATALKEKITNDTLLIKEKNVQEYSINNRIHFIGTSNHHAPIEIEPGDRRYFIIKSKTTGQPVTQTTQFDTNEFFKSYYDWLYNNLGLEKILSYLLKYDLSGFNPDAAPAMSMRQKLQKKEIQEETSLPDYYNEVAEFCAESDHDLVPFRPFKEAFNTRFTEVRLSDKMFSNLVIMTGAIKISKKISVSGKKITITGFCVKNHGQYNEMEQTELAKQLHDILTEEF